MEKKRDKVKGRNVVRDSGEEAPFSESAPFVSISDDDGSSSDSPMLPHIDPTSRSKPKGKQPIKIAQERPEPKITKPNRLLLSIFLTLPPPSPLDNVDPIHWGVDQLPLRI